MTEESAVVVGKLLVAIVFGFVLRPLAIIYGLNLLLAAVGMAMLPYTLLVYLGVLLVILALNVEVSKK